MTNALLERGAPAAAYPGWPGSAAAGSWLLDAGTAGPLPPVLVFPHAGGGPAAYRQLAQRWSTRLHPFLVHLPGRESRMAEEPMSEMPGLIRALAQAALPLLGSRFVLYGHSMGALVAFELARQGRRCFGIEPDHLVVSGYPARRRGRRAGWHLLPDQQLWDAVLALGGMPAAVASDPELRSLLLPVLRADFRICETYSYLPDYPLTCPISAFAGTQDSDVPVTDLAAWAEETSGEFHYEMLPGDHFFNVKQPGEFAGRVLRELAVTLPGTPPCP